MTAFFLEQDTRQNNYFRNVLATGEHLQLTVMSVKTNIPEEIHHTTDQFIYIVEGSCEVIINGGDYYDFNPGDGILIPANTFHEIKNTGSTPCKLFTIYSNPLHPKNEQCINIC